jgi:hypothetical protein
MTTAQDDRPDPIDVDAIMEDLRRRVAEKKARGLYGVDALMADAVEDDGEPFGLEELERLRELAVQRVDIEVASSTKPVVGGAVSKLKRLLVRGTSQPVYGLSAQATAFNGSLLAYLSSLAREVAALERQMRAAYEQAELASTAATDARARLAAAEERLARLDGAAIPERLARLERPAPEGAAGPVPPAAPLPAGGPGDTVRLRLEAVESGPGTARRIAGYAAALAECGPVLHLGAGSGRGLEALGEGAEGVEADAGLAAAAAAEGRAVRHADPVAFVAALAPGSVGGILVTDLVERLDGPGLAALAAGIGHALAPDGRVVVEGWHPASLWAVGEEFWRDAGRRRPVHPEGVRIALEAAGLGATSVELLDAPDGDGAGESGPLAERVAGALFGPRRYAVHAGR